MSNARAFRRCRASEGNGSLVPIARGVVRSLLLSATLAPPVGSLRRWGRGIQIGRRFLVVTSAPRWIQRSNVKRRSQSTKASVIHRPNVRLASSFAHGWLTCTWMVELRSAFLRAKKHLPQANMSGLEDGLGPGCEVPSDGASLFLTSAQMCGSGTRAEQVALESVSRLRLSRAAREVQVFVWRRRSAHGPRPGALPSSCEGNGQCAGTDDGPGA